MDSVIEVKVDAVTLNAAQARLNGLGLSVQEAVVCMMEKAAEGEHTASEEPKLQFVEKTISVSEARQRPGEVSMYIGEPGNVILMTSHGRGKHALMSVETYRNLRAMRNCAYA